MAGGPDRLVGEAGGTPWRSEPWNSPLLIWAWQRPLNSPFPTSPSTCHALLSPGHRTTPCPAPRSRALKPGSALALQARAKVPVLPSLPLIEAQRPTAPSYAHPPCPARRLALGTSSSCPRCTWPGWPTAWSEHCAQPHGHAGPGPSWAWLEPWEPGAASSPPPILDAPL